MFGLIRGAARGKGGREPSRVGEAGSRVQIRGVEWGAGHDAGRVTVKAGRPIMLIFQRIDSDAAASASPSPRSDGSAR